MRIVQNGRVVDRDSWDEYFGQMAELVAGRGTCSRLAVGAVIEKNNRTLATGYNGVAPGDLHCDHEGGGDMKDGHCARAIHAEENAIRDAEIKGLQEYLYGATIHLTHPPCSKCAPRVVEVGIMRVTYRYDYREYGQNPLMREFYSQAGVRLDFNPPAKVA